MHMQIQHKNTPLVCRKFLSPGCAPKGENYFFLPWWTMRVTEVWRSKRGLAVKERVGLFVTPHTSRTAHYIILNEFRTAYLSQAHKSFRNATRLVFLLFLRNAYTTKYNTCVIETRTLLYTIIETTLSNVLRKVSKLKCFIHNANTFT